MSSIVTTVLKATIGLLVNKSRDTAAEKLKDGDVTDDKIRGFIVRDLENIKDKLDALSRKDLLASISFFKEGIEYLCEVLNKQNKARSRTEYGAVTTQAACAEAFSLAQGMKNLELTDLDESALRALSKAKKKFEDSGRKATEAFHNEALETSDRILAMQYRVMAAILETIDNPADAVIPCRVCIEELNSLSAVQNSFNVQLKKGLGAVRGLFGKDERRKIISNVCHLNRVIYDVTQTIGQDTHFWIWPAIDTGEDKVDPLRDGRVTEVLRKQGMEHCCVTPWRFGHKGEREYKLCDARDIATNSMGQFIVVNLGGGYINVFDSSGTFMSRFRLPDNRIGLDVDTDLNDNIYVLGAFRNQPKEVYKFNNTGDLQHMFLVRGGGEFCRLTVTDSEKLLVLREVRDTIAGINHIEVAVYETDGRFVRSFGKDILKYQGDVTAATDGRVMVVEEKHFCVHIFSEKGDHLKKFELQGSYVRVAKRIYMDTVKIAFHRASELIVVADNQGEDSWVLGVEVYTKDGKYERSTYIRDKRIDFFTGMAVTSEGRIALAIRSMVLVI